MLEWQPIMINPFNPQQRHTCEYNFFRSIAMSEVLSISIPRHVVSSHGNGHTCIPLALVKHSISILHSLRQEHNSQPKAKHSLPQGSHTQQVVEVNRWGGLSRAVYTHEATTGYFSGDIVYPSGGASSPTSCPGEWNGSLGNLHQPIRWWGK